jgi:hypothetical protein
MLEWNYSNYKNDLDSHCMLKLNEIFHSLALLKEHTELKLGEAKEKLAKEIQKLEHKFLPIVVQDACKKILHKQ